MKNKMLVTLAVAALPFMTAGNSYADCNLYSQGPGVGGYINMMTGGNLPDFYKYGMNDKIQSVVLNGSSTQLIYFRDTNYGGTRWVKTQSGWLSSANRNVMSSAKCR